MFLLKKWWIILLLLLFIFRLNSQKVFMQINGCVHCFTIKFCEKSFEYNFVIQMFYSVNGFTFIERWIYELLNKYECHRRDTFPFDQWLEYDLKRHLHKWEPKTGRFCVSFQNQRRVKCKTETNIWGLASYEMILNYKSFNRIFLFWRQTS